MTKFIKDYGFWIITHLAAVVMAVMLLLISGSWKTLTPYSGYSSACFLVAILALNPLKSLFPTLLWVTKLNRHRQEIGVAAFSYAVIHLICFIVKRGGFNETLPYLFLHPAIVPAFWVAFIVMFLLALTSNRRSMKTLGFAKWKKLHKKVYYAELAVFIHMIILKEVMWALILFTPLLLLQLARHHSVSKD